MRVYEIAKEVGIPNKDLITKIRALGLEVNNHMSSLDADDVARIKRSLDKEKASVAAPAQTTKMSTGTVLRRRSTGEKASDGDDVVVAKPPAPVTPPPAVVPPIRRRPEADAAPVTRPASTPIVARPPEPRPEPVRAPEPQPVVAKRQSEPVIAVERPVAPPPVAPPPAREPAVARDTNHTETHAEPMHVEHATPAAREVQAPPPVVREPAPEVPAARTEAPVEPPARVEPVRPTPPVAATPAAEPPTPPARSRVIVAGPQVIARNPESQGNDRGHDRNDRGNDRQPPQQARQAEAPASTPLPPRVTPVRPPQVSASAGAAPEPQSGSRTIEMPPQSARSRFEMDLERARERTASKPRVVEVEVRNTGGGTSLHNNNLTQTNGDAAVAPVASPTPTRDPSRPAVGTVIALPPRIKITERTPLSGRPAPGPQPVNPIRGRYAQQQQMRGRPGGGRPGGPHDMRKKLPLGKKGKQTTITTPAEHKRVVRIEDTIAVADLARNMGVKAPDVLKKLWGMGMTGVNINASIDFETAQILASEFGYEVQNVAFNEEEAFAQPTDDVGELEPRAPVVTVMGHVDHGKTSLLDAIRKTKVASGEAGGITQHVAAYKVKAPNGKGEIVFLDTPGHEAFTEMRARGAQATDIVVLVVAANDGVMPQTLEALNHAKDAKVTIIVAVNKIDLPDAQPERVKQQLADHGLIAEEWGGDTIYVNVSALKGENIDKLLASIVVSAEVLDLKASKDKPASGLVIEARLDRSRGPMATVLVQEGTLRVGDIVVAGRTFGKVRALLDDTGKSIDEAGPSTPVEILGLDGVPDAGDQVNAAEDDKVAKQVVDFRRQSYRKRELASTGRVSLESLMARISEGIDQKELKIVLKADVQGSAEALKAALIKLTTEKVKVNVIAAGVGGITESDVNLAKAGNAIIVGFHVRPAGKSTKLAEQEDVEIKLYDIIYDALDEVRSAMAGLLAPIKREIPMGKLQVRDTFSIPKIGTVAGCMVTDGKITRKAHLRLIRDAVQIYEGKIGSLRRFKDDVSDVGIGYECGVMIAGYNDVKKDDIIEAFEVIEEAAKL